MMKSLLIANRGEIACRIIRTAREMGIRTVAIYSDADAGALHVRQADEAVHIGPPPAAESYLLGDRIIAAAREIGAEAIHPGYGFLSENAQFAQSVLDSGLIWVGPNPSSIMAMGLKDAAKKLMDEAGVPTTPGYLGENQDPEFLKSKADEIGYPVLIKAVAGGGGKGMRKVDAAAQFADALESCQREARASFGNDVVLIEKWIESPRHIEVQVFGDTHGNVVHLFERDCSLQRRHQKVIEEAPAPGMSEETRAAVCLAAVNAAKAVDYIGAGTIEFIADGSEGLRADRIWFMEMNTRLQVEHPVTEEITGVDLVEWQLRIASGEPLPLRQEDLSINGHAIEARLYAEDPATGFLPSTGVLTTLEFPEGIRVETGVDEGDAVSPFYDPMIAKLVATGDDRGQAIDELKLALDRLVVWPVRSNAGFLFRCLDADLFVAGDMTTNFIADAGEALIPPAIPTDFSWRLASLFTEELGFPASPHTAKMEPAVPFGFRLNSSPRSQVALQSGGERRVVSYFDECLEIGGGCQIVDGGIILVEDGQPYLFEAARFGGTGASLSDGTILAPMPGRVIAVNVAAGDLVENGQKLLTLEAMKMEHTLTAPFDGTVAELNVAAGEQVEVEAALAVVEPSESAN